MRVLIVDDNQMMVKTLQDIFRLKGYDTEAAYSGPEALAKIDAETFACVLSDIRMPGVNGVDLFRAIKARRPEIPVVLMTAYVTDEIVREGLAEGVVAVLNKPLNIEEILAFFARLDEERSITIVDDDPDFCRTLGDILQHQGFKVQTFTQVEGMVEQLAGQIVLLDMKLHETDGLALLREIRQHYPQLPVVVITGYPEEYAGSVKMAIDINAYTSFYKPVPIDELLRTLVWIYHQELGRLLGQPITKPR